MNFSSAKKSINNIAQIVLKDFISNGYTFTFSRYKNLTVYGFHNLDNKIISINSDFFFLILNRDTKTPNERIYTFIPLLNIPQSIHDHAVITIFHERNHALDKTEFFERIPDDLKEIFALENVAFINPVFQKLNSPHSLSEYRSIYNSIMDTKNFFLEMGFTENQAQQKIIDAINTTATINHQLHYYPSIKNTINKGFDKSIRDKIFMNHGPKFESWSELKKRLEDLKNKALSCSYYKINQTLASPISFFLINDPIFDSFNEKLINLPFTTEFFLSLSQKETLYFQLSILNEYSRINISRGCSVEKDRFTIELSRYGDTIKREFVDINLFVDKLNIFRSKQNLDPIEHLNLNHFSPEREIDLLDK